MLSDEALYATLVGGDTTSFDELYRRYEGSLFGFILKQLGDRSEAEDVFHEAFLAVLRERRTEREIASFKAWIFQVARNLCLNRIRSRARAAKAIDADAQSMTTPEHPESLLAASQAPAALKRAVERLPEPLANLYQLRTSGLSYDEIAQILEVPLGTVKSRMHEMVERLRKEIQPWTAS